MDVSKNDLPESTDMKHITTSSAVPDLQDASFEDISSYVPDTDAEKRLVRKLDLLMLPTLWLMCVLAYVDRNNIVSPNSAPSRLQQSLIDKHRVMQRPQVCKIP
jgi:hypothetical protein